MTPEEQDAVSMVMKTSEDLIVRMQAAVLDEDPRRFLVGFLWEIGALPDVGADPDDWWLANRTDSWGECDVADCDRPAGIKGQGGQKCRDHHPHRPVADGPGSFEAMDRAMCEEFAEGARKRAEDNRARKRQQHLVPTTPTTPNAAW